MPQEKKIRVCLFLDLMSLKVKLMMKLLSHVTTFTDRWEFDEYSSDVSYEKLATSYKELCVRIEEVCEKWEKHKRIITQIQAEKERFLSTIYGLQDEITLLTSKLENMTKPIRMSNKGSDMLDEILQVGKGIGNLTDNSCELLHPKICPLLFPTNWLASHYHTHAYINLMLFLIPQKRLGQY